MTDSRICPTDDCKGRLTVRSSRRFGYTNTVERRLVCKCCDCVVVQTLRLPKPAPVVIEVRVIKPSCKTTEPNQSTTLDGV